MVCLSAGRQPPPIHFPIPKQASERIAQHSLHVLLFTRVQRRHASLASAAHTCTSCISPFSLSTSPFVREARFAQPSGWASHRSGSFGDWLAFLPVGQTLLYFSRAFEERRSCFSRSGDVAPFGFFSFSFFFLFSYSFSRDCLF